ncbi:uncharacterized protein LOC124494153 [Dermatophagoides farinae]|uniref:Uncharacterized protein n=1 Tax=Dermatophagoides farinae TaxID=6954 RepID=A0A922KZ48_DERFA|nr:hypothetical protein DERF_011200 [Dermatophagoides farinae]
MSMTQSFDYDQSSNTNANAATTGMAGGGGGGGGTNAEYDLKDAQLDEASASTDQHGFGPGNILGGGIGNLTQQASQVVKQGADAVVNAGKGIVEMGGSVISGLKRGFSKTSEGSGGE